MLTFYLIALCYCSTDILPRLPAFCVNVERLIHMPRILIHMKEVSSMRFIERNDVYQRVQRAKHFTRVLRCERFIWVGIRAVILETHLFASAAEMKMILRAVIRLIHGRKFAFNIWVWYFTLPS